MAKKHFGRFLTLAAVVGAAAAGISYFLQYKSFHKELDEDFHDFEDDFDDFDDTAEKDGTAARNYVPLTPEKQDGACSDASCEASADSESPEASSEEDAEKKLQQPSGQTAEKETSAPSSGTPSPDTTVTVEEITE